MNGRPPGRFDRRRPEQGLRINHRIRVPEIRVILEEEQLGIMPTHEALRLAEEKGLDLVEISPRAFPPVCRIMDYGKYKYEEAKKKQQARKRASTVETKEIKFRPKTEEPGNQRAAANEVDEEDDLDEDQINADVEDDEDDDETSDTPDAPPA